MCFDEIKNVLESYKYAIIPYELEINSIHIFVSVIPDKFPNYIEDDEKIKRVVFISKQSKTIDKVWFENIIRERVMKDGIYVVNSEHLETFRLYYDLLYLYKKGYKYRQEIDCLKKEYNVEENELVSQLMMKIKDKKIKLCCNWKISGILNVDNYRKIGGKKGIIRYTMYKKARYGFFYVFSRIRKIRIFLSDRLKKNKPEIIFRKDKNLTEVVEVTKKGSYSGCRFFEGKSLENGGRVFVKGFEPNGFNSIINEQRASALLGLYSTDGYFYNDLSQNDKYVIFPYETNPTLSTFLRENKLTLEMIKQIISQFVEILDIMYDCGIIHRDIREDNIIIDTTNNQDVKIKIIDFGWAVFRNNKDRIDNEGGLTYKSFEIVLGGEYRAGENMWDDAASMILLVMSLCCKNNINIDELNGYQGYNSLKQRVGRFFLSKK